DDLPVTRELIRWNHRLRLFYYYNRPGKPLALLFRPVTAAISAPFRRRDRAEVKLYLQLGGVLTALFLVLDLIEAIAEGGLGALTPMSLFGLWMREAVATFLVIYAFATPIGAVLTVHLLMRPSHFVPRLLRALVVAAMPVVILGYSGFAVQRNFRDHRIIRTSTAGRSPVPFELMRASPSIIYTWTDEAPFLATHAFLPVVRAFAGAAGVPVETRDISLAGRVLAAFADLLPDAQKRPDDLAALGRIVERPDANIIKLPNISASVPQLKACIRELQAKGFQLPDYPDEPATDEERDIRARYDRVKGSAVNPVLRQGNSDRRAPKAVKDFARANPPRMKPWPADSRTHVATMQTGDFFSNERSITLDQPATVRIEHVAPDGTVTVLRDGLALEAGEVFDSTAMSRRHLVELLEQQVRDAKESGVRFSLHLKATMMKVSDPIIFGHAVRVYFQDVFRKHEAVFEKIGVNPNNGLGDVLARIAELPNAQRAEIEADIRREYESGPPLAMVDSARGITNLHVPSDVIIDASMPPMIRDGGRMWNAAGELQDCKAVIPDSSYAGIYQAVIDDCREHGQFDPATMGSVSNVGLMAQKAEEYGSHDKTFEIERDGVVRVVSDGHVLIEHSVEAGDIWRACQTKDVAIRDWVRLAVARARATGNPAVFWLDRNRAHDAQIIRKVEAYLPEHDTSGLTIEIMKPSDAMRYSLERIRRGEDTI